MIIVNEWYKAINQYMPKGVKCKTFSVYPSPYPGYSEIWIDGDDGKKYRGLLNGQSLLSDLVEFILPGGMINGEHKCATK